MLFLFFCHSLNSTSTYCKVRTVWILEMPWMEVARGRRSRLWASMFTSNVTSRAVVRAIDGRALAEVCLGSISTVVSTCLTY